MQQSEITNDIYHLFISASKRQKVFIMSLVPFRTHLSIRREKKSLGKGRQQITQSSKDAFKQAYRKSS